MELSEAFVRIVGRHLILIALLVGCGLLGGGGCCTVATRPSTPRPYG